MDSLPAELLREILLKAQLDNSSGLADVCKRWKMVVSDLSFVHEINQRRLSAALVCAEKWKSPRLLDKMIVAIKWLKSNMHMFNGYIQTPCILKAEPLYFAQVLIFKSIGDIPACPSDWTYEQVADFNESWEEMAQQSLCFQFESVAEMQKMLANCANVSALSPNENWHDDDDMA